jgi:hypothetical protein
MLPIVFCVLGQERTWSTPNTILKREKKGGRLGNIMEGANLFKVHSTHLWN